MIHLITENKKKVNVPKLCNIREVKHGTWDIREESSILEYAGKGAKGDESWLTKFYPF